MRTFDYHYNNVTWTSWCFKLSATRLLFDSLWLICRWLRLRAVLILPLQWWYQNMLLKGLWIDKILCPLQWRHNEHDSVSNHPPHDCLLNRLSRRRSKKTSKLCATGLCAGNSPGTGEFPAQMASYAENVSIWWRHHVDMTTDSLLPSWMPYSITEILSPCSAVLTCCAGQ